MKKSVKNTVGHFKVLLDHSQRPYEPSPEHILRRIVKPLCRDFSRLLDKGTKNDAWEVLEGFAKACQMVEREEG